MWPTPVQIAALLLGNIELRCDYFFFLFLFHFQAWSLKKTLKNFNLSGKFVVLFINFESRMFNDKDKLSSVSGWHAGAPAPDFWKHFEQLLPVI